VTCCSSKGPAEFFTERVARRDARRYRKKGLNAQAKRVVDFLRSRGIDGRTVLEVGGGAGGIQLDLLKAGAARAVNVEMSPAYEREAEALLREAGFEARAERVLGDFVERAAELEPADAVILHKVVCCYPDYEALVGTSAERARRHLVMTFPRDAWWTRLGVAAANAVERVRGHSFRSYVHPPAAVLAVARQRGFTLVAEHRGGIWEFAALERA
jgi:hypothetical protein